MIRVDQGVNKLFVNEKDREAHTEYFLPKVEIKYCNIMVGGTKLFDQPIINDLKIYDNFRKIASGREDDYAAGCLLDYPYFKEHYKLIGIDLSKQQALDINPKAIQLINFTGNLEREVHIFMFFNIEEAKETVLDFSQGTVKVL